MWPTYICPSNSRTGSGPKFKFGRNISSNNFTFYTHRKMCRFCVDISRQNNVSVKRAAVYRENNISLRIKKSNRILQQMYINKEVNKFTCYNHYTQRQKADYKRRRTTSASRRNANTGDYWRGINSQLHERVGSPPEKN